MDNAEDLDVAMPMYNLIEYMQDYSKKPGTLWNYYGDRQVSINEKQLMMEIQRKMNFLFH